MPVSRHFSFLVLLCWLAGSALLAPAADASTSPASTVKAGKKPGCERNAKREARRRRSARGSADLATESARAKKCVKIIRAYSGKTSQGQPIELKTRTTEFGTKLISGKLKLFFLAKVQCTDAQGNPYLSDKEFADRFYVKLRGPARKATFSTMGSLTLLGAVMTGKVGTANASGEVSIPADEADECAATSFTFSIPRVKNSGGGF